MQRIAVALAVIAGGLAASGAIAHPVATSAATCSDYPNQREAQLHHDTRDADHDGIYCEDLPCPCLKPGHGGSDGGHRTSRRPRLGRSILLGPVRKRSICRVHRGLPDRGCTPGARYQHATTARVCRPGYAGSVRKVSDRSKDAVYAEYGLSRHFNGRNGEVDHLVSLELGGSNVRANLFPEAASPRPGSHDKDRLENRLHDEVCSGQMSLRRAQREIATDWVAAYHTTFG